MKNRLSEYVRKVQSGEGVFVTDRGEVVAELIPAGPGSGAEPIPPGLAILSRRGQLTLGASNDPDIYPTLPSILTLSRAKELLDEERGSR